jgi:hypothetical protein
VTEVVTPLTVLVAVVMTAWVVPSSWVRAEVTGAVMVLTVLPSVPTVLPSEVTVVPSEVTVVPSDVTVFPSEVTVP